MGSRGRLPIPFLDGVIVSIVVDCAKLRSSVLGYFYLWLDAKEFGNASDVLLTEAPFMKKMERRLRQLARLDGVCDTVGLNAEHPADLPD
jgi:hypothetical protein